MKIALFIAFALFANVAFAAYSISHFEGPPFTVKPTSGMYNIEGLGLDNLTNGQNILAYGDFNNDKYTDIVTLADDQKTLTIHIYSHESFAFWPFVTLTPGDQVASVIPGDYNYDGQLDLLLVVLSSQNTNSKLMYFIRTQEAPFFGLSNSQPNTYFTLANKLQPLVFDVDGDRKLDLLYDENGSRMIQTYDEGKLTNTSFSLYVSTSSDCKSYADVASYTFTVPHSNTFADFNGDCAADLLLTTQDTSGNQYLEFWLRNPSDGLFCLVDVVSVTTPISHISVGDMNNDGRLDLVYAITPTSTSSAMTINVLYNQYSGSASAPCTLQDSSLKNPFDSSAFFSTSSISGKNQAVALPETYAVSTRLFSADTTNRPARIRIGDINIDGYSDLIFIISEGTSSYGKIVLAINQASTIVFGNGALAENQAYYSMLDDDSTSTSGDKQLEEIKAISVSFFDYDELGKLGLWIVDASSSATKLIADFNFVNTENFILKTLGLTGVKPSSEDDITQSLGGIYYGASVECTVTDIMGATSLSKAVQLAQSSYTPLDLPYAFIGLGRTNNYVENFAMGVTKSVSSSDVQQTTWTPIIPNSQLIVNPLVGSTWTLDVFVNPTSETILIVLTALVLLLLLGAVIIYLHSKEKEEDEQGRTRIYVF